MYNDFFLEDQLADLETREDVGIVLEDGNFLDENRDRYVFQIALQAVGRYDLATKLEIYLAGSKWLYWMLHIFNQKFHGCK